MCGKHEASAIFHTEVNIPSLWTPSAAKTDRTVGPWSHKRRGRLPSHCSRPCPCSFEALRRLQVASRTNTFLSPQETGIANDCKKMGYNHKRCSLMDDPSWWTTANFTMGSWTTTILMSDTDTALPWKKGRGVKMHLPMQSNTWLSPLCSCRSGDEPCRHCRHPADLGTWFVESNDAYWTIKLSWNLSAP